jgi:hypothetical protein
LESDSPCWASQLPIASSVPRSSSSRS